MADVPPLPELKEEFAPLRVAGLYRGASRLLFDMGYAMLPEVTLPNGRRADLLGLDRRGRVTIIEIKSSLEDFRADQKWPEYLDYCDSFYFAVGVDFPLDILPEEMGLIVADAYGGVVRRDGILPPLAPARRRALVLKFGLYGALRLQRLQDPDF